MSFILNIDTAVDAATISIANEGVIVASATNTAMKEQGGFLQPGIASLLKDAGTALQDLDAIAVSAGPGSYTGLRVGMATAKGLCYALNKPFITIGTLEILAYSAIEEYPVETTPQPILFCPMIDARRMEVFTALYTQSLHVAMEPCAMVLNENSFANSLLKNTIVFLGNGAPKWRLICKNEAAVFASPLNNERAMSKLSYNKFKRAEFANLAYAEPIYIKEFFDGKALPHPPILKR